jgi:hypothetical protein
MCRWLCLVLVLGITGWATAGVLDLPNELANSGLESGDSGGWTNTGYMIYNQGDAAVPVNAAGGRKWAGMLTSWAGSWTAPMAVIRQVIDESQSPGWQPDGTGKIIDVEFDYFLNATNSWPGEPWRDVGVKVFLNWDSAGGPLNPASPTYQHQLVFQEWRNANVPDPIWKHADVSLELAAQPQFVGIEIEAHAHNAEWSYVGFDNVGLESQCLPEPSGLILLALGSLVLVRRL